MLESLLSSPQKVHERCRGMGKCWEKGVFPTIVIQKVVNDESSSDLTILRSSGCRLRFSWMSRWFSHLRKEVSWILKTIREELFIPLTWSWFWLGLEVRIHRQTQSLVGHNKLISQVSEIYYAKRKTKVPTLFFCKWSHLRSFTSGSGRVPWNA